MHRRLLGIRGNSRVWTRTIVQAEDGLPSKHAEMLPHTPREQDRQKAQETAHLVSEHLC